MQKISNWWNLVRLGVDVFIRVSVKYFRPLMEFMDMVMTPFRPIFRFLKKWAISILSLLYLFIFIGMAYFMHSIVIESHNEINHTYAYLGGFGIWVPTMCLMASLNEKHFHLYSWFTRILSALGALVAFALVFSSILIMFISSMPVSDPEKSAFVFRLDLAFLAYTIFCFFTFWTRFQVREETLVFPRSRILFPGEKYTWISDLNMDSVIVPQRIPIEFQKLKIACSDISVEADIETAILLDISQAKNSGLLWFDLQKFKDESRQYVMEMIVNQARSITAKQLLSGKMEAWQDFAANMPFTWEGEMVCTVKSII